MTDKITLTNLVNLQNETTAVNAINTNSEIITLAFDNTLSRDGTGPNQMGASIDMNHNSILNLPAPSTNFEPLRVIDASTLNGGGTISVSSLPIGGTTGQVLAKNSNTNFDAIWETITTVAGVGTFNGRTGTVVPVTGDYQYSNNTLPLPVGYQSGMTLSNDVSTPNTVLDIASGICRDNTDTVNIKVASSYTKSISSNWAVGTGTGGLDTGTATANNWYHVFAILRPDTGVTDYIFSLSLSPTLPTNYTKFNRIGSFRLGASATILAFTQVGNTFLWTSDDGGNVAFVNTVSAVTTAVIATPTVPTGVQVEALIRAAIVSPTGLSSFLITSLEQNDQPTSNAVSLQASGTGAIGTGEFRVRTNTSGQIRIRASQTGVTEYITTAGWVEL